MNTRVVCQFKGKFEKLAKEHERLEDTHHQAAKRLQELEENQGILERNISCMYETALQQVKRKDVIIADLRDQLAAAKAKRNR